MRPSLPWEVAVLLWVVSEDGAERRPQEARRRSRRLDPLEAYSAIGQAPRPPMGFAHRPELDRRAVVTRTRAGGRRAKCWKVAVSHELGHDRMRVSTYLGCGTNGVKVRRQEAPAGGGW